MHVTFKEDNEDNEVRIAMALGQFESILHLESRPWYDLFGGSCKGKAKKIERIRMLIDKLMHLNYFTNELIWGSIFFFLY